MSKDVTERRIDQWLFYSRLVKSRSLAGRLVEAGKLRVNKVKVSKPSSLVRKGDVITSMINRDLKIIEILELGVRRGPASEAKELYNDITPKEAPRPKPGRFIAKTPSRPKGEGRPTKKDRRKYDSIKPDPQDL
ncbi:RNA-binding S4 domain-containing protein [Hyphomicrobiales bacterium 4NK60-0047b]